MYWMYSGRSRLNFLRYAATIALMSPPVFPATASCATTLASMGSPGASLVSRNTSVMPTHTIATNSAMRRATYEIVISCVALSFGA